MLMSSAIANLTGSHDVLFVPKRDPILERVGFYQKRFDGNKTDA